MPVCTRCGVEQGAEDFPVDRSKATGRRSWCKICANESRQRWYDSVRRAQSRHACIVCGAEKIASEFRSGVRGGRLNICVACTEATPAGRKICSKCREAKPLDQFYPHNQSRDGKQPSCKPCFEWQKLESELLHPGSIRRRRSNAHIRRSYKLTATEYQALVEQTGGLCMACGQPETIKAKDGGAWPLCVDHNHETGEVRGLLCHSCNRAAGAVNDDPVRLRAVAAYLEARTGR
jgi:hypothetical protein